jgi:tetratricopeptide (TPR) repeat protein
MDHTKLRFHSKFIVCFLLVVITLMAYRQLPSHGFLSFDDNEYITQNAHIQQGLSLENIAWAFNFVDIAYWHPITWIFHMLFFQLFGMNPSMHHLMNLFLHIANSLLLFMVLKRMTGALWQSAFVAFMFALHPLNVESVAWVSELKNVLSTFFWMLTMLLYVRYVEHPGFYRYLIMIFVFALGLMAKPMLVTLPFILLLLDYWPLNRFNIFQSSNKGNGLSRYIANGFRWSRVLHLILEKVPFLSLSAVCIYLSSLSLQRPCVVISTAMVPMKLRIANAIISYVGYIKKMAWPYNLGIFYPFPIAIPPWMVASAGLFLVCITCLSFRWARTNPYFTLGWLWYIGTLVPGIGLVQAGLWPSMADRFAYVPLIGLFIIIAWGIPDLVSRWRFKKLIIASIAVAFILNFGVTTYLQNRYWANNISLYKHTLDVTKDNAIAHQKLGEALLSKGKTTEAARHFCEALRITPSLTGANLNLGVILRGQGKLEEATEHFSRVAQLEPSSVNAYCEIAVTMEKQNNFEVAVRYYLKALRLKPDSAEIHNNLGIILARQNKEADAMFHFKEAIRINPDYAPAHYNLGKIYANQQNVKEAILNFKKTLQLNPNMAQALYNLSWILASHKDDKNRNGKEAVRLATELCKITTNQQPLSLDALAAAYAETGEFDIAVSTAQKGLELAKRQGPKELVLGLKKRLALYRKGQPYRQNEQQK